MTPRSDWATQDVAPTDSRPGAVDVASLVEERGEAPDRAIVEDLILEETIVLLTGEEGEGKTMLAEQICRQIARGDKVLDFFELGELRPSRILFVDTEMERSEVRRRCFELDRRNLGVDPGHFFWLTAGGLDLAEDEDDRRYIESEIQRVDADFVWIDAGSNAVADSKDDVSVRQFFNWISWLMRELDVIAVGVTVHPRKRAQGDWGRRFDDLFGTREWKGRASKVVYIDGRRMVAWKDRGGHLRRRLPSSSKYPQAVLDRPGFTDENAVPFQVHYEEQEPELSADPAEIEAKVLELLRESPNHFTKSTLAGRMGGRRGDALSVIERLLNEGQIGPNRPRAKLQALTGSESATQEDLL